MTTSPRSTATSSLGSALVGGTAAGIVAAVVNAIVFATGVIDPAVETPAGGPITLAPVVMFSVTANIIGGAVFWAVQRRASSPLRTWQIVVAVVTLVSFVSIVGLQGAPTTMRFALVAMHVIAGAAAFVVTPAIAARRAE